MPKSPANLSMESAISRWSSCSAARLSSHAVSRCGLAPTGDRPGCEPSSDRATNSLSKLACLGRSPGFQQQPRDIIESRGRGIHGTEPRAVANHDPIEELFLLVGITGVTHQPKDQQAQRRSPWHASEKLDAIGQHHGAPTSSWPTAVASVFWSWLRAWRLGECLGSIRFAASRAAHPRTRRSCFEQGRAKLEAIVRFPSRLVEASIKLERPVKATFPYRCNRPAASRFFRVRRLSRGSAFARMCLALVLEKRPPSRQPEDHGAGDQE